MYKLITHSQEQVIPRHSLPEASDILALEEDSVIQVLCIHSQEQVTPGHSLLELSDFQESLIFPITHSQESVITATNHSLQEPVTLGHSLF